MTKVIYIAGCGRSGSTLLNAMLGSLDDTIGVGELVKLPQSGWTNGEYCACGETVNRCNLWREVRHDWSARTGSSVTELVSAQLAMERSWSWHRPVLGIGRRQIDAYSRLIGALYAAIAAASGKSTIVDASKNPLRAIALTRVESIDVRLVHLVRDLRGVAWSLAKRFDQDSKSGVHQDIAGRSPLKSLTHWSRINLFSEIAMSVVGRKGTRVRYEDLMSAPARTIDSIGEVCGIDVGAAIESIEGGGSFTFGHMAAGNRIRMQSAISVRPDFEWQSGMSVPEQRRLWRFGWPFMRRYNYPQIQDSSGEADTVY